MLCAYIDLQNYRFFCGFFFVFFTNSHMSSPSARSFWWECEISPMSLGHLFIYSFINFYKIIFSLYVQLSSVLFLMAGGGEIYTILALGGWCRLVLRPHFVTCEAAGAGIQSRGWWNMHRCKASNRPVSQMHRCLSRTSGKLWQDYSSCYIFLNIKRNIFNPCSIYQHCGILIYE